MEGMEHQCTAYSDSLHCQHTVPDSLRGNRVAAPCPNGMLHGWSQHHLSLVLIVSRDQVEQKGKRRLHLRFPQRLRCAVFLDRHLLARFNQPQAVGENPRRPTAGTHREAMQGSKYGVVPMRTSIATVIVQPIPGAPK
jgi:hypothetical protein